ncbi:NlpC/P60 family protein (plasmid) [Citricoccus nitrophenolicus]
MIARLSRQHREKTIMKSTTRQNRGNCSATRQQNSITCLLAAEARALSRNAAIVTAAAGLALGLGGSGMDTTLFPAPPAERAVTSIPAISMNPVRASATDVVLADDEAPIKLGRVAVSSRPAPEPETEPEPVAPVAAVESPAVEPAAQTDTAQVAEAVELVDTVAPELTTEVVESAAEAQVVEEASGSLSAVVAAAYQGIGTPYVYGGKGPGGWDCSGFTSWAYAQAGITIPSSTSAIRGSGKFVPTSTPKPGDLVFQNGGGHVGIYVGNGQMIGAQNPTVGTFQHSVTRNPLMGYYTLAG